MKENTIIEFADNGIIIKYENNPDLKTVLENKSDKSYKFEYLNETFKSIAYAYGSIVCDTIESFDDDTKKMALGYKVSLTVEPILNNKDLNIK